MEIEIFLKATTWEISETMEKNALKLHIRLAQEVEKNLYKTKIRVNEGSLLKKLETYTIKSAILANNHKRN